MERRRRMSQGCWVARRRNLWKIVSVVASVAVLVESSRTKSCIGTGDYPAKRHQPPSNHPDGPASKASRGEEAKGTGSLLPRIKKTFNTNFTHAKQGYYYSKARGWVKKGTIKYGNYRNYYGYRGRKMGDDVRLRVMKAEWFERRRCLDIGCNEGVLSLSLCLRYGPEFMRAIDIDPNLIGLAIARLKRLRAVLQEDLRNANLSMNFTAEGQKRALESLKRVRFQSSNWLAHPREFKEYFETVTCFSVTKWIHLNWGDQGIRDLFRKCETTLRPGGYFILEPQPWKSYLMVWKKRDAAVPAVGSLKNLRLRPRDFQAWIENNTCLTLVEVLKFNETEKMFQQPRHIYVFRKKETSNKLLRDIQNRVNTSKSFGNFLLIPEGGGGSEMNPQDTELRESRPLNTPSSLLQNFKNSPYTLPNMKSVEASHFFKPWDVS